MNSEDEPTTKTDSDNNQDLAQSSEKVSDSTAENEPKDCDWVDNFCCKKEPEAVLTKMYKHFVYHHSSALKMLEELKEQNHTGFDKFEKCTDVYTLIQMLTFMYGENVQFKTIVDEFNTQYATTGVVDEKIKIKCAPAKLCEEYRAPVEEVKKCLNVKNEPPYGSRSPTCDSVRCLDRDLPEDSNTIFCDNSKCSGHTKKRKCLGYFDDSKECLLEKPNRDNSIGYFDCSNRLWCKQSSCYPCTVTANQTAIKRYLEKYLQAIEAGEPDVGPRSDDENACKCNGFRKYVLNYKQKLQDEEENKKKEEADVESDAEQQQEKQEDTEKIVCPCEQCPSKEKLEPDEEKENEEEPEIISDKPCGGICKPCGGPENDQEQGDKEEQENKEDQKDTQDKITEETELCSDDCANVTLNVDESGEKDVLEDSINKATLEEKEGTETKEENIIEQPVITEKEESKDEKEPVSDAPVDDSDDK